MCDPLTDCNKGQQTVFVVIRVCKIHLRVKPKIVWFLSFFNIVKYFLVLAYADPGNSKIAYTNSRFNITLKLALEQLFLLSEFDGLFRKLSRHLYNLRFSFFNSRETIAEVVVDKTGIPTTSKI